MEILKSAQQVVSLCCAYLGDEVLQLLTDFYLTGSASLKLQGLSERDSKDLDFQVCCPAEAWRRLSVELAQFKRPLGSTESNADRLFIDLFGIKVDLFRVDNGPNTVLPYHIKGSQPLMLVGAFEIFAAKHKMGTAPQLLKD